MNDGDDDDEVEKNYMTTITIRITATINKMVMLMRMKLVMEILDLEQTKNPVRAAQELPHTRAVESWQLSRT